MANRSRSRDKETNGNRVLKFKRITIPLSEIPERAFEVGMTPFEYLAFLNKVNMGGANRARRFNKQTSHPIYINNDFDNFDWKKWRYGE